MRLYDRIPDGDREVLVDVFEREVGLRTVTLGDGALVIGFALHPNPNARLYVRVVEKVPEALPRLEHEQMVVANLRSVRFMQLLAAPELLARWRAAMDEAYQQVGSEERALMRTVVGEMLSALDAADERDRVREDG